MKTINYAAFFLLLFLYSYSSLASHALGGEITYKCLDPYGNYKITLVYYRDCSGIPTCNGSCSQLNTCTKTINIRGVDAPYSGTLFKSITVNGVSVRDISANKRCPNSKSICDNLGCITYGSATPGIERYEFSGTVSLGSSSGIPSGACRLSISYEECCQTGALQNMNPDNYYIETIVDRCNSTYPNCNSSDFTNDPYTVYCGGQGIIANLGAFSPDLDSLSYSLVSSMKGYGVPSVYVSPYTANLPLPYTGSANGTYPSGFNLTQKGDLMFTPLISSFTGGVRVKISQWRMINGFPIEVGSVQRHFMAYFRYCTANSPPRLISNPPGLPNFPTRQYDAIVGKQNCFYLSAVDSNSTDTTFISWDKRLESLGATLVHIVSDSLRMINGPRADSVKICWSPTNAMLKNGTTTMFPFSINVMDNICPYPGRVEQGFAFRVLPGVDPPLISSSYACGKTTLSFTTNSSNLSSIQWKLSLVPGKMDSSNYLISNSSTINVKLKNSGRYPVQLTLTLAATGVPSTFYDTVNVDQYFYSGKDTSICILGTSYQISAFNSDTIQKKFKWYILPNMSSPVDSGLSFTRIYNSPSKVVLKITDSKLSCIGYDTTSVMVYRIKANIGLLSNANQCTGSNLFKFKNLSADSFNNPVYVKWILPNGDTSLNNDTVFRSYVGVGNYQARIYANNNTGCTDSATRTVYVNQSPSAAYSFNSDTIQCLHGNVFRFNNLSSVQGSDTFSSTWDFGNTIKLISEQPVYTYPSIGTFNLKLVVTTSNGCKDSVTHKAYINPSVNPGFIINDSTLCAGTGTFTFTNSSSLSGPGSYQFNWIFPDNTGAGSSPQTRQFSQIGSLPVYLICKTDKNCYDTIVRNVYTFKKPVPSFTSDAISLCQTDTFHFQNTSNTSGTDSSLLWTFEPGKTATTSNPSWRFTTKGIWNVKLVVGKTATCADSAIHSITAMEVPKIVISINDTAQCNRQNNFIFNNTSTYSGGALSFLWDFGDSIVSPITSPSHHFSSDGIHYIKLKATPPSSGCPDSAIRVVRVKPNAVVRFTSDSALCGTSDTAKFTNLTTVAGGSFTSKWDFGDASTSTLNEPIKVYSTYNTFLVRLMTTTNQSCRDTFAQSIRVARVPIASFTLPSGIVCEKNLFTCTNTTNEYTEKVGYAWNMDSIVLTKDLTYRYDTPGIHIIKLYAVSEVGCYSENTKIITIQEKPVTNITGADPAKFGSVKTYTTPYHSGSAWAWIIQGDSSHSALENNVTITWASFNPASVSVVETGLNGCSSDTLKKSVQLVLNEGLDEATTYGRMYLYPNPAGGLLWSNQHGAYEIFSNIGAIVAHGTVGRNGEVVTEQLAPGYYTLVVTSQDGSRYYGTFIRSSSW